MRINENEGCAEVYTPYSAQFVSRLKQEIGGARWNGEKRCWTIPSESVSHCRDIMKDIFGETVSHLKKSASVSGHISA